MIHDYGMDCSVSLDEPRQMMWDERSMTLL